MPLVEVARKTSSSRKRIRQSPPVDASPSTSCVSSHLTSPSDLRDDRDEESADPTSS